MDECLSNILGNYDISKGYDSDEIRNIVDDYREFLEETYDDEEMSVTEIDEMLEEAEALALETIAGLVRDKEETTHEETTHEETTNEVTKEEEPEIDIEESLARIEKYAGDTQRTAEWFERRHQMLTASIAGDILKVDLEKKKGLTLIRNKIIPLVTNLNIENDGNENVKTISIPQNPDRASVRGTRYEPIIRDTYASQLPDTDPTDAVLEYDCVPHPKYPFLGASPDGIVIKGPLRGRMVEIKCPLASSAEKDGRRVRHTYWCQMQLQMEVCDLPFCDYVRAIVWDTDTSRKARELLREKIEHYKTSAITPEIGEQDSKVMVQGTVWMDGKTGEYVYEKPGRFVKNGEIYARENVEPVIIRHYFILAKDWMVIKVERNREWFQQTFLPKARETWEEVLRGRENPEKWHLENPKRVSTRSKVIKEYESNVSLFVDSE